MDITHGEGDASLIGPRMKHVRWIHLTATFCILLLFSWLGIVLSRQSEGVATIWFTNGLLFALLMTQPRRVWIYYFVAGFMADTLADVLYGDPLRLAAGVSIANSVEVVTSSLVLTRIFGTPFELTKRRTLLGFLGVAVVAAPALTALLGSLWTMLFVDAGPLWTLVRTWYLGDMLGMAIIAPLVMILQRPGFFRMFERDQLAKTLLILTAPAIATILVFTHSSDPLEFFIFPALLFVVFRLGFPGSVLGIFTIALFSIALTVKGHGPLMLMPTGMLHRIVVQQIFLAVAIFTFFPVAALLEERKELEHSLLKSETRYRELANADFLTGLANRRVFDERLAEEWQRSVRTRQPLGLVLIDVDMFKAYNDIYGHIGGDECLRCIARVIGGTLQRSVDMAARFGGEEFAVILPNTAIEGAMLVAEHIRQSVEAMGIPNSGSIHGVQTVSLGVAVSLPDMTGTVLSLLASSDHALYRAKYLGRNRVESMVAREPIGGTIDPETCA